MRLENLEDARDDLFPLDYKFKHFPSCHKVLAHHFCHLISNLLLALQKDALDVNITAADNVRPHRTKYEIYAKPICEVTYDEARHGQNEEASPTMERSLGLWIIAFCFIMPIIDNKPQEHLDDSTEKAQDCRKMLDEDEFTRADLLKHLNEQWLVFNEDLDGHLLYIHNLVDVQLHVSDDWVEHFRCLLKNSVFQFPFHHVGESAPDPWGMLLCKLFNNN
mmetsp:Transcript_105998/g.192884  ORF Transcript_105998/g.192884 Transcript_105998/m.192884 type:complete len:220 (+) Transcript_105998:415-1074(+)